MGSIGLVCGLALLTVLGRGLGVDGYKPLFLLHGLNDNEGEWKDYARWVQARHPGTQMHPIPLFDDDKSLVAAWVQAKTIGEYIRNVTKLHPSNFTQGYHLVCHSQGGILCRSVIESMNDHNVSTFISLAGPQMGEYGEYGPLQELYPDVVVPNLWRVLYTWTVQDILSVADYWHDTSPEAHDAFLKFNRYLPVMNGQAPGPGPHDLIRFKTNFMRVKRAVFFGSDGDTEIMPWQSSVFGSVRSNLTHDAECIKAQAPVRCVLPREEHVLWVNDTIGLRQMHQEGRAVFITPSNITHMQWTHDENVFVQHVLPELT
eukprot:m.57294 g.57294  ORF g.57294 m.57294 type:complete len:316 (-) comp12721_c0_seq2:124-1071(-)